MDQAPKWIELMWMDRMTEAYWSCFWPPHVASFCHEHDTSSTLFPISPWRAWHRITAGAKFGITRIVRIKVQVRATQCLHWNYGARDLYQHGIGIIGHNTRRNRRKNIGNCLCVCVCVFEATWCVCFLLNDSLTKINRAMNLVDFVDLAGILPIHEILDPSKWRKWDKTMFSPPVVFFFWRRVVGVAGVCQGLC